MAEKRPILLFVSPITPHPMDVGVRIRIRNLLECVSELAEVDFVGYHSGSVEATNDYHAALCELGKLCRSVAIMPSPSWRVAGRKETGKIVARYLLSGTPAMYAEYPHEAIVSVVRQLAPSADLIWVERLYLAYWLSEFAGKMVVDVDDFESVKLRREQELDAVRTNSLFDFGRRIQVKKLVREEQVAIQRYLRLVVCSEADKKAWSEKYTKRVWVIPNGTDDRFFDLAKVERVANRLIYVGTLDYFPNIDAVHYFYAEIFPLVLKEIPNTTLWIVGKNPGYKITELHDGHTVIVEANVPEVAHYVQQAVVSIVPLRVGGGTRLKILESLALGTPVVSTTVGAEGLELADGEDLLIADNPDSFAAQIVRLLKDKGLYDRLAESGRRTAGKLYRWSQIRSRLAGNLQRLIREELPEFSELPRR